MTSITILLKKSFDAKLLFTDTDSLTYEIKPENVCEEFFKWKDLFELSDYSKDSKLLYASYCRWICWIKVKNVSYKKLMVKNVI